MLYFEPWKKALIGLILLTGLSAMAPNFFYERVREATLAQEELARYEAAPANSSVEPPAGLVERAAQWPSWLPNGVVNLGLDLQGGSYFLLEAQLEQAYAARLESLQEAMGPALRDQGVRRYRARVVNDEELVVRITNAEDMETAGRVLRGLAEPVGGGLLAGGASSNITVVEGADQSWRITLTDAAQEEIDNRTMASAIEVVRSRVDGLGVREPTVQRQGRNRILLQLPGANDVNVDELTKVAKLEFRMVDEGVSQADIAAGRVPRNVELVPSVERIGDQPANVVPVFTKVDITGDSLAEAFQDFDQNGLPGVTIRFDASGARAFARITRGNVGRRFAMVLDGEVLSAPEIRTPIVDGSAIITGSFSVESANALAVNLRSGNLPVEISVEESSVVGPELGADSIAAGQIACIVGFVLVLIYMALSYGLFGLLANLALLLNVALIFGALSMLGATLTLPGIAGIVLTIGMAVDANVLVFERIREELRRNRGVVRAIETGYRQALSAIIDANVTTFIAAIILFAIGSGPVKGFAVTLAIGIVTSVFTAVMLTRFFVSLWYDYARPKTLEL
ncbi:MAG: protein translocase subunit SecD [Pseudomonadota bacterium]